MTSILFGWSSMKALKPCLITFGCIYKAVCQISTVIDSGLIAMARLTEEVKSLIFALKKACLSLSKIMKQLKVKKNHNMKCLEKVSSHGLGIE